MACMNKEFSDAETRRPSLSEALLIATMCIIGLPVEVHVKDGSVFSGIFHTACVENGYGVVLKKARITRKGKMDSNIAKEVVDTLVILSSDLIQVVAKGVLLPAGGLTGSINGDTTEAVDNIPNARTPAIKSKKSRKPTENHHTNQTRRSSVQDEYGLVHPPTISGKDCDGRQLLLNNTEGVHQSRDFKDSVKFDAAVDASRRECGDDESQGKQDEYEKKFECRREESTNEIGGTSLSCEEKNAEMAENKLLHGVSKDPALVLVKEDNQCCERSTSATISSNSVSFGVTTSLNSDSNRSAKEFKLNPEAKNFSPSFASPISAIPLVPTVANMAYIPENPTVVPVAVAQPEVGFGPFASRSAVPAKYVPYGNLSAANGGSGSQYSQPIVGHVGTRTQPLRYATQHPIQVGPAYMPQNSQAVMVSKYGQLIYVHPASHDLVQGPTAISTLSARPVLTSQQAQFQKHQGSVGSQSLQLCAPPQPFIASGHQPLAVPNCIPLWQPTFPVNRPIQVPGPNGLFNTKF